MRSNNASGRGSVIVAGRSTQILTSTFRKLEGPLGVEVSIKFNGAFRPSPVFRPCTSVFSIAVIAAHAIGNDFGVVSCTLALIAES